MQKSKFDWILVTLASVDDIAKRSNGAVDNPDTVNYRTWRPKQHWLFCETILDLLKITNVVVESINELGINELSVKDVE